MSNYTKATNFASKDNLSPGEPDKKVKGVELDNEFNAISNAVSTKADLQSPEFTGTPSAPTATAGTNTTQIATTAFVSTAIDNIELTGGDGIDVTDGVIAIDSQSNGFGNRTVSTSAPSGGNDGDIWYKV